MNQQTLKVNFIGILLLLCSHLAYTQIFTKYQPPKQELGEVLCIAVDKDNIKWIGTPNGLYRFTGDTLPSAWHLYDNPHTSDTLLRNITAIAIDKHNHKWVASYHNGVSVIELDKHGKYVNRYEMFNFQNKDHYIRGISIDKHDRKWIATKEGGVWVLEKHGKWSQYDITTVYELPSNHIYSIGVDSEDVKWVGTDKGLTSTKDGKEWDFMYNMDFLITAITTDAKANVCVCVEKRKKPMVYCNGTLNKIKGKDEFTVVSDILLDKNGILWAAGNGLAKYEEEDRIIYDKNNSNFKSRSATRLAVDEENMIWIGTVDDGLYKLDPKPVVPVEEPKVEEPVFVKVPLNTVINRKNKPIALAVNKLPKPTLTVKQELPPRVLPLALLNAKIEPYKEEPEEEPVKVVTEPVKPVVVVQPAITTEADGTKVANIQGQQVKKGAAISLKGINFKTNSDEFTSYQGVEQLLQFMLENPTVEIELSGHTDRDPTPNTTNYEEIRQQYLDLSQRRVDAVAMFLQGGGVKPNRITTKAYGGSKPLVAAVYSERNRRVELRITKIE